MMGSPVFERFENPTSDADENLRNHVSEAVETFLEQEIQRNLRDTAEIRAG